MMKRRHYQAGFKAEAVKRAIEIGITRAAEELKIPYRTLASWVQKANKGEIDLGQGSLESAEDQSIVSELQMLKKQVRELQLENARIKAEYEILADTAAYIIANRRKS